MSAPSGLLASSQPSSWVSTMSRTSGSPSSGTPWAFASPVAVTWIFHQEPRGSAAMLSELPSQSRARVKASTSAGSDRGVRGQVLRRGRQCQVQHRAEHDAARAVLRFDRRRLEGCGAPSNLLGLLEQPLEQLGPAECGLAGRFLEGEHRRSELVAEARQEVVALLVGQALPDLGALSRDTQPAVLGPAHQAAVQEERLPGSAGRRKVGVGGAVAKVIGNRLHPAADPNPDRRRGAHKAV